MVRIPTSPSLANGGRSRLHFDEMMARRLSRGFFKTMFEVNFVSGALDVCVNARACASGSLLCDLLS